MGRFDHLATEPRRGVKEMFRWKVIDAIAGKNRKDAGGFVTPRRDPDRALIAGSGPQLTWIGHASFLVTLGGLRVLVDPVLAPRLGPIARLAPPGLDVADLADVDVVLVTHNHRDHMDDWSITRLGAGPRYVVPLGNAAAIRSMGGARVDELDWWQTIHVTDGGGREVEITLVPARHWSMRLPWDRNDALWGGFVIRAPEGVLYHSGDTAFFDGFTEIGKRVGSIDWALLPIGAYEPRWFMHAQHMCPEEAIEAFGMLGARSLVAMHWGTFRLTDEPIAEPPERARAAFPASAGAERLWILDVGETRNLAK